MGKNLIYDTVIIGAGPCGMTAAIHAARDDHHVLLLDRLPQVGKKILVTGNGRCNFTNLAQKPAFYRSDSPERAWEIIGGFDEQQVIALMGKMGVFTKDREGYLYPYNDQASSVREAFDEYLRSFPGITVQTGTAAEEIRWNERKQVFSVLAKQGDGSGKNRKTTDEDRNRLHYYGKTVIVATGGLAGVKSGCEGDGYGFAAAFGHSIIPPLPALTALVSHAPFLKKLAGVRCRAAISLQIKEAVSGERPLQTMEAASGESPLQTVEAVSGESPSQTMEAVSGERPLQTMEAASGESPLQTMEAVSNGRPCRKVLCPRETGELQWTDYGISGVAVFCLSRFAIRALREGKRVSARIDLMPDMTEEELSILLSQLCRSCAYKDSASLLRGLVSRKLAPVLLREARIAEDTAAGSLQNEEIAKLVSVLKGFTLNIQDYKSFDKAQTTMGGIPLSELTTQLESVLRPGLFFAGEVVDVDGTCGGYNLQWAFASGRAAGEGAYLCCR